VWARPAKHGRLLVSKGSAGARLTGPDEVALVYDHRPGSVAMEAPAVVELDGRGADERNLLPIGARLPDDLDVLGVRPRNRWPGRTPTRGTTPTSNGLHGSQGRSWSGAALTHRTGPPGCATHFFRVT